MPRTVETILRANTTQHDTALRRSAQVTEQSARTAVQAGVRVDRSLASNAKAAAVGAGAMRDYGSAGESALRRVERASQRAVAAQRQVADAASRVAAAEARLASVRSRSGASTAQVVAAEENLARAQRASSAAVATAETRYRDLAAAQQRAAREGRGVLNAANRNSAALNQVSSGVGLAGAAVAAGVLSSVKAAADFDQSISNVAATGAEAKSSLGALRQQALDLGAATKFSATEAADGQEALLKAGVATSDVLGGALKGSLDLAASGGLEVADSAEIAATAMSQFKLQGKDVPHIADLLAAGAGKAQGEVSDMALALKYAGVTSGQMGVSLEETAGTIALLAYNGTKGEQAGTSLRGILSSLTSPSKAASDAMRQYGINVYDAQGKFVGFRGVAEQLQTRLGKLDNQTRDAALGQIFGNEQITAARILYSSGASDVDKWTRAVNDNGYAAETAATKMDNLRGDIEQLGGALATALIGGGEGGQQGIRTQVQAVTGLVDAYNDLPGGAKTAITSIAGVTGVAALASAGVLKLVTSAAAAKVALAELNLSSKTVGLAAGGIGLAFVGAGLLISHFAKEQQEAKVRTDDLTDALLSSKGALDANVAAQRAKSLEDAGALSAAQRLGVSIEDITQASLGNADAQARVNDALGRYTDLQKIAFQGGYSGNTRKSDLAKDIDTVSDAIHGGNQELDAAMAKYDRLSASQAAAGGSTDQVVDPLKRAVRVTDSLGNSADVTADALQEMIDKFSILRDGALSQERANSQWQASIDGVSEAVRSNRSALAEQIKAGKISKDEADRRSRSLDVNTEAGRKNRASISDAISALNDKVTADFQANVQSKGLAKATDIASEALRTGRKRILDSADAAKLNRDRVKGMQDRMLLTPKELQTKVSAPGLASTTSGVQGLDSAINGVNGKNVTVGINWRTGVDGYKTSFVGEYFGKGHAKGGILPGHTPLSKGDDIMFPLARGGIQPLRGGEGIYVTEAMDDPRERRRLHAVNAAALRGDSLDQFHADGLARGGTVVRQSDIRAVLGSVPSVAAATAAMESYAGAELTRWAGKNLQKYIDPTAGLVAGGGYAAALAYAKKNVGHPYVFGSLWDCSGFMSSLHSIIKGESPHRRYVTPDFVGPKAEGFTRGKRSPFMIGVNPSPGKLGHMAGTLNGVNVESAGGVGVRIGGSARGWDNPMFSWRGGLARGGRVGDLPYDLLSPRGQHFDARLLELLAEHPTTAREGGLHAGTYDQGGQLKPGLTLAYNATGKPEPVLTSTQWSTLRGLATGGIVGLNSGWPIGLASGGTVPKGTRGADLAYIRQLIAAITDPLREVVAASNAVRSAQAASNKAQAALRDPGRDLARAKKRDDRAKERRQDLREEVAALKKRADATKGTTKADRDYKKAQQELRDANNQVARTSKAKQTAQEKYDKVADRAKAATDKLKDAQAKLRDVQQQIADQAQQVSEAFTNAYGTGSSSARDNIDSMRSGAKDLIKFNQSLSKLRAKGLNEASIQQIIEIAQSQGVGSGQALADSILQGGTSTINAYNQASAALKKAGDALGYSQATQSNGPIPTLMAPPSKAKTAAASIIPRGATTGALSVAGPATVVGVVDTAAMGEALKKLRVTVVNPWTGKEVEARVTVTAQGVLATAAAKADTRY